MTVTRSDVERMIDASLGATPAPRMDQVEEFVRKTLDYNFAATLAEPYFIKPNAEILHAAGKKLCTVISYPLGSMNHESKVAQIKQALVDGADECDIAMDVSAFKSGHYDKVKEDLKPCVELMEGRICKLLYFASILTEDEQKRACDMAIELGFPMLKTNLILFKINYTKRGSLYYDQRKNYDPKQEWIACKTGRRFRGNSETV